MLTRRRFLGYAAAGTTAVAVPTVIIPKVQAALAAETPVEELPEGRLQRQLKLIHKREVERLYDEEFATTLKHGSIQPIYLWRPAGHPSCLLGASICIEKEVWFDIGGHWQEKRCQIPGCDPKSKLPSQFVNFHLFNHVDPTTAHGPGWSGCRTHPYKEPYLNLREALDRAVHFEYLALQSGDWVRPDRMPAAWLKQLGDA